MRLLRKSQDFQTNKHLRVPPSLRAVLALILLTVPLTSCIGQNSPTINPTASATDLPSRTIELATGLFVTVRFSPDGKVLAVAGLDGLWLVDTANIAKAPGLITDPSGIRSTAFTPDSKAIAYGDGDGTVHIAQLQASPVVSTSFKAFHWEVESVAFSPDGKLLAVGGLNNTSDQPVELWTVDQLNLGPRNLIGHQDKVLSVAFSPDGKTLASGGTDGDIDIWNISQAQPSRIILRNVGYIPEVAFSPNGDVLASAGDDGRVLLWKAPVLSPAATPTVLNNQPGITPLTIDTERAATSLAFSPDSQWLAVSYVNKSIQVFNLNDLTHAPMILLGNFRDLVNSVAFSPDGQILAGGGPGILQVWNVTTLPRVTPSANAGP